MSYMALIVCMLVLIYTKKKNHTSVEDVNGVFKKTYLTLLRHDILRRTKYYDRYDYSYPACMDDALTHVQNLTKWKKCEDYTKRRRVWNVIGRKMDANNDDNYIDPRFNLK